MDQRQERLIDIALLIALPLGFFVLAILSYLGYSRADFGETYVFTTEALSLLIVMTLPVLRITKKFRAPYWFILIVTSVVYIHSVSLYFGLYQNLGWWDIISHGYSSFVVTMTVFIGLLVIQRYTTHIDLGKGGLIFMLFIIGFGFGNFWEMWEWLVDNIFGDSFMSYSVYDTLGDIVCDAIGAGAATLVAAHVMYRGNPNNIVDQMDLDRFMSNIGKKWDRKTDDQRYSQE